MKYINELSCLLIENVMNLLEFIQIPALLIVHFIFTLGYIFILSRMCLKVCKNQNDTVIYWKNIINYLKTNNHNQLYRNHIKQCRNYNKFYRKHFDHIKTIYNHTETIISYFYFNQHQVMLIIWIHLTLSCPDHPLNVSFCWSANTGMSMHRSP